MVSPLAANARDLERELEWFAAVLHARTVTPSSFNLQGGSASFAANVNDWLGFAGDFGYYSTKSIGPSGFGLNIASYMFGPRISYRRFEHFTVFAQQLIGVGKAFRGDIGSAGIDDRHPIAEHLRQAAQRHRRVTAPNDVQPRRGDPRP